MNRILFLLIYIFALHGLDCNAQDTSSALYVHTDKHIYTPGETIWFKAYFNAEFPLQETLHVKIIDLENNSIVTEREFPVYDIRAHGQIVLSDSIEAGSYNFIAFGNRSKNLDHSTVYLQKITIAAKSPNMVSAKANVLADSKLKPGEMVKISFQLKKGENNPAGVKGECIVSSEDRSKVYNTIKIKTDNNGIATASFTYPEIGPFEHLYVRGEFNNRDNYTKADIYLPSQEQKITTSIFIEGGQLISNTKNKILVILKDENGLSISSRIELRENNTTIKTAITDSIGVALLEFTPLSGKEYEIIQNGKHNEAVKLPKSNFDTAIQLIDNKTLKVINTGEATTRNFELRSGNNLLYSKEIKLKERDSLLISLPKSDTNAIISAGLRAQDNTFTNERLFVQGAKENYKVTITVPNTNIKPHERVIAKIVIEDTDGKPVQANVSVAVVSKRVIDKKEFKSIKNCIYNFAATHDELQDILKQSLNVSNKLLIGKEWRDNGTTNTSDIILPLNIKGRIKDRKNKPAYLDKLTVSTADGAKYITIEKDGSFIIPAEYLIASEGQQNYIVRDGLKAKNYHIEFDTVSNYTKELIDLSTNNNKHNYSVISKEEALPVTPDMNNLDEVIIEKRSSYVSDAQYQSWVREYPKNCRDFVCEQNVLNCSSHKVGLPPHLGEKYVYEYNRNYIYKKCLDCDCKTQSNTINLRSITRPEAFKAIKFEGEYDVKYYSTLYWNSNLDTDANGKANIEFTASDLTGAYTIIIQGINNEKEEVIYGEGTFEVIANY